MKVKIETGRKIIAISFDNDDCQSSVVARRLDDSSKVKVYIKGVVIDHSLTAVQAREYADLLSLLASTSEMMARTITKPEDFGKDWAVRMVGRSVIIDEVAE